MLSVLFQNLREYTIKSSSLDNANRVIPNQIIVELRESEKSYMLVSFQELLTFGSDTLEFGSIGVKITKEKKCTKGWKCGFTCLPATKKNCTKAVEGQAKTYTAWLELEAKREGAKKEVAKAIETTKPSSTRDISKMNITITKADKELLDSKSLTGTEKQVTWANTLRQNALIDAKKEAVLYAELVTMDAPNGDKLGNYDYDRIEPLITQYVASKTDAKYWIDNRNRNTQEDTLRPVLREYSLRLAKEDDPRLSSEDKQIILERDKNNRDRISKERSKQAKYDNLQFPELDGTEKQISYAKSIQTRIIDSTKTKGISPEDIQLALDKSPALKSAKWWIENQTTADLERVIGKVKEKYNVK